MGAVKPLHHIAVSTVSILLVKGCVVGNKIQPRTLTIIVFQVSVTTLSCHIARCIVKIVNIGGTGGQTGGLVGRDLSETIRTDGSENQNVQILWVTYVFRFWEFQFDK